MKLADVTQLPEGNDDMEMEETIQPETGEETLQPDAEECETPEPEKGEETLQPETGKETQQQERKGDPSTRDWEEEHNIRVSTTWIYC